MQIKTLTKAQRIEIIQEATASALILKELHTVLGTTKLKALIGATKPELTKQLDKLTQRWA